MYMLAGKHFKRSPVLVVWNTSLFEYCNRLSVSIAAPLTYSFALWLGTVVLVLDNIGTNNLIKVIDGYLVGKVGSW